MKGLRVISDVVQKGSTWPVLPFLAPATLLSTSSPAPSYFRQSASPQHIFFSRRFISFSPSYHASTAQAVKEHDTTEEPQPALSTQSAPQHDYSEPSDIEKDILQDFVEDRRHADREQKTNVIARDIEQTPLAQGEYVSPRRKNQPNDAASKEAPRKANAIFDSLLRKTEQGAESQKAKRISQTRLGYRPRTDLESAATSPSIFQQPAPPEVDFRLDPYMGRSVPVKPGVSLAQAIRRLDFKLRANHVRADLMAQRFHERPGLKRKRLKSERWRKRFKEGFKALISQVEHMRNKGW